MSSKKQRISLLRASALGSLLTQLQRLISTFSQWEKGREKGGRLFALSF